MKDKEYYLEQINNELNNIITELKRVIRKCKKLDKQFPGNGNYGDDQFYVLVQVIQNAIYELKEKNDLIR